jgi:hypothetical protein
MPVITFSHPTIEKSNSTVAVLGNAKSNPPQKLWSHGKQLFVGNQRSLKSIDNASFSVSLMASLNYYHYS